LPLHAESNHAWLGIGKPSYSSVDFTSCRGVSSKQSDEINIRETRDAISNGQSVITLAMQISLPVGLVWKLVAD
jgi:hypothetical protein